MNPQSDSESVASDDDVEELARRAMDALLPAKSKCQYEAAYARFQQWCKEKKVESLTENVLLAYFQQKSTAQKPSSLWSQYSMLRTMLSKNKNVDISKYNNLIAFLKRQNDGYKPKKSNVLTKEDITKFLIKADDANFLMMKVILIIGVAGGCRREELCRMLVDDVHDRGDIWEIIIPNTKTKCHRQFIVTSSSIEGVSMVDVVRKYVRLRPKQIEHRGFFVNHRNGKCTKQPVGINTFGSIPKNIALFLELPNPSGYTGHSFRRSSASLLADAGADILTLKRHGAWKSSAVVEGYIQDSIANKRKTAIKILGEDNNITDTRNTIVCEVNKDEKAEEPPEKIRIESSMSSGA